MTEAPAAALAGDPLGIICGAGDFPLRVAQAAQRSGRPVVMIGIKGTADPAIEAFPYRWVHVGQVGKVFRTLRDFSARDVVLVGAVRRPAARDVRLDWTGLRTVAHLGKMLSGGDDRVLAGIVAFIERHGFRVLGLHEIAEELLVPMGILGAVRPGERDLADVRTGRSLLAALGPFDVGQTVIVADGRILAVEAAEGTDAALRRVADLREAGRLRGEGGCLVKMAKPTQDLRVDLPAVGVETLRLVRAARLSGIAVEAGRTIAPDQAALIEAADAAGLFVLGFGADGAVPT